MLHMETHNLMTYFLPMAMAGIVDMEFNKRIES